MKNIFYLFTLVIVFINISNAQQVIDTIEVSTGWNIIGALSTGATSEIISTEPPGIITSPFWGFEGAYYQADSLKRGTGYWVKVNQDGLIIYMLPAPPTDCGTVNYSGKIYNTVIIGEQCWLKENLNVGSQINGNLNQTDNSIIEKYCYNNDSDCPTLGGLYQWAEVVQYLNGATNTTSPNPPFTGNVQGICPTGWHLPTYAEFQTLSAAVGGSGNALKEIGQGSGGGAGTNTSGFSALLAGYRHESGTFYDMTQSTYFWTSTEQSVTEANHPTLAYNDPSIYIGYSTKVRGYSVRCLKD